MPSSKGKPTDPELREKVKEEVKNETNKDGGGKGQWSAWKATKLSKEYEKKGGGYENEAGSKNEPVKGKPKPKEAEKKKSENKASEKETEKLGKDHTSDKAKTQTPKANIGAKKSKTTTEGKGAREEKKDANTGNAKEKAATQGVRKSARFAEKRERDGDEAGGEKKKAKK
ncbi:hypothetical protein K505DRAFT_296335 [Melanomma pulvis-pyrius CBS 109.77]|uniref:Hypervirulence associated protein TUDOR domain-containing protein n=1 Tax=Melanomma pulvis-pyrius CBS 109.77 TaxID=1314802 RepID=A0A6A6XPN9_9PLEO|nr:hypothetical protein K505DRAFT_296335 [Melanomma pulvis-pyrius CBS 109.77]